MSPSCTCHLLDPTVLCDQCRERGLRRVQEMRAILAEARSRRVRDRNDPEWETASGPLESATDHSGPERDNVSTNGTATPEAEVE